MRSHVGKFYKNFARYLSAYKTTKSYLYTVLCRYEKIDITACVAPRRWSFASCRDTQYPWQRTRRAGWCTRCTRDERWGRSTHGLSLGNLTTYLPIYLPYNQLHPRTKPSFFFNQPLCPAVRLSAFKENSRERNQNKGIWWTKAFALPKRHSLIEVAS